MQKQKVSSKPVAAFKEKSVFGRLLVYPANDDAKLIMQLIGCLTLRPHDERLKIIEKMGYEVEVAKFEG